MESVPKMEKTQDNQSKPLGGDPVNATSIMKTASQAEAKHTLQRFFIRQKIPPVIRNATGIIINRLETI